MLERLTYLVLGLVFGSVVTISYLNKQFAPLNANNLAVTYYRSCTVSVMSMANRNNLKQEAIKVELKNCYERTTLFYNVLVKNL